MTWFFLSLLGLAFAYAFGIYARALVDGTKEMRARYRRIVDTERSRIGALREGFFEVRGRVVPRAALLTSPMRNAPCVYYELLVREVRVRDVDDRNRRTRKRGVWVQVVRDVRSAEFVLSDGTGEVRVPVFDAEKELARDATLRSGFLRSPPEQLKTLLRSRYHEETQGELFNKAMQWEETSIAANDELYVLGEVKRDAKGLTFTRGDREREDQMLLVTDRGEDHVRRRALGRVIGAYGGAAISALISASILAGVAWLTVRVFSS